MRREQRLVFGEVAELYDRHRPAYPDAVVDDLVELAGLSRGSLVLEVGAGTGKASSMFATRGIRVLAVEPSAEMAAVARRVCAAYGEVRIEQSDFERWDPAGREFPLVFAAQAWHWVEPAVGRRTPRCPGGSVAATSGLSAVDVRDYEWSRTYSGADYAALLETHSTVRALDPDRRRALLSAVARAIENHGNSSRCRS